MSAPMAASLRHGASSDIGRVREVQEDSLLVSPPLFAVADGMGGHSAGDVASRLALDVLSGDGPRDLNMLREAVVRANRAIYEKAGSSPGLSGMGTTITAMLAGDHTAGIAHVGDSRAYLLREGELQRLTEDHTVIERMVREGRLRAEDAAHHPQRSILERALGVDGDVEVDVSEIDLRAGDRILLCTDGLTGLVDEDEIREVLRSEEDPARASDRLVAAAVQAGGHDNVTAVVVYYAAGRPTVRETVTVPAVRRRSRRLLLTLVSLGLLIVAAGLGTRAALAGSFYVASHEGRIAVFRGIPGSVAGIELHRIERTTSLRVDSLPEYYRRQLADGIRARDETDAERIIRNLRSLEEPPPAPAVEPTQP